MRRVMSGAVSALTAHGREDPVLRGVGDGAQAQPVASSNDHVVLHIGCPLTHQRYVAVGIGISDVYLCVNTAKRSTTYAQASHERYLINNTHSKINTLFDKFAVSKPVKLIESQSYHIPLLVLEVGPLVLHDVTEPFSIPLRQRHPRPRDAQRAHFVDAAAHVGGRRDGRRLLRRYTV